MTNEEAIECLKYEKSGCRYFVEYSDMNDILENASSECGWMTKAIDKAIEALEKQSITEKASDKYRWHDLRKNPNDLPIKDGLYAVAVKYFAEEKSEIGFGQFENMYGYGSGWSAIMPSCGTVIAWREIEPFEEER